MAVDDAAKEETPLLKSEDKKEVIVVIKPDDIDDDTENLSDTPKSCATFCGDLFLLISIISIIINLCMLLSQIWPSVVIGLGPIEWVLRAYIACFNIVFIFVELEWMLDIQWITKYPIMANFVVRGIIYSFLGLITVEQSIALRVDMLHLNLVASTKLQIASVFLHISAYCMTCLGGLYFIMGVFCMKEFRDRCRRIEKEQKKEREGATRSMAEKEALKESMRKEILKEEGLA